MIINGVSLTLVTPGWTSAGFGERAVHGPRHLIISNRQQALAERLKTNRCLARVWG